MEKINKLASDWKKILINISHTGFVLRIYKELSQFSNKKTKNSVTIVKRRARWHWDATIHTLECVKIKRLTSNVDENV